MTINLVEFPLKRSKIVQGFPLDIPPIVRETPMEATDQGATVDSHVEENPAVEVGEEFTTYDNPLVHTKTPWLNNLIWWIPPSTF